ncbi:MAG TPA: type II TA system antitoxin MqsA family protein [Terriglobales bacterium]|nr:type II TA system antitoxin MqsA family protein [Terriglobales bacterium]
MTSYVCPECGKGKVSNEVRKDFRTKVRGNSFVVPEALIGVCDNCHKEFFNPKEVRRWAELYDELLKRSGNLLAADEIVRIRQKLDMSGGDFGLLLGCTRQTVYNWERPDRKAPQLRMADLLLRLVDRSVSEGAIDVLVFLRNQAGALVARTADHNDRQSSSASAQRRGEVRLRAPEDYDAFFQVVTAPVDVPALTM